MSEIDDEIQRWIFTELSKIWHEYEMNFAYDMHQDMWGVPCGPTLTMVYPTVMTKRANVFCPLRNEPHAEHFIPLPDNENPLKIVQAWCGGFGDDPIVWGDYKGKPEDY